MWRVHGRLVEGSWRLVQGSCGRLVQGWCGRSVKDSVEGSSEARGILPAVGIASHWSAGPPAAEMSAKEMEGRSLVIEEKGRGRWMAHGK